MEVVQRVTTRPAKRHLSLIDTLHALTGLKPGDIAPIILPAVEDDTRNGFRRYIAKDRDASIRVEAADKAQRRFTPTAKLSMMGSVPQQFSMTLPLAANRYANII